MLLLLLAVLWPNEWLHLLCMLSAVLAEEGAEHLTDMMILEHMDRTLQCLTHKPQIYLGCEEKRVINLNLYNVKRKNMFISALTGRLLSQHMKLDESDLILQWKTKQNKFTSTQIVLRKQKVLSRTYALHQHCVFGCMRKCKLPHVDCALLCRNEAV